MLALMLAAAVLAGAHAAAVQTFDAAEARQGVAVDNRHFYAVDNSRIAKYDRRTGQRVALWEGDPARFPHINSCAAIGRELVCAASNYPKVPHASSVEFFDPVRMTHLRSVALAEGPGSLTWVQRRGRAWWAAFANYDGRGGEPGRDHRYTTLVQYDDAWRPSRSWRFPDTVLARFAPSSSSGGVFDDHGALYVTGHDHAELYVLQVPEQGPVLTHISTIAAPIEGQAIARDPAERGVFWGINRKARQVIRMRVLP